MERLGANYLQSGPGILRKIPQEALDEIGKIFDETGGTSRYEKIEEYSRKKAEEMGINLDDTLSCDYFRHIYTVNQKDHTTHNED